MMICREVGCDLAYCQNLMWKPKTSSQRITDCNDEYSNFRQCVIREKKIFRSIIGEVDLKKNPGAITDYLEKHFKEKEAKKKQRQMMGAEGGDDLLRAKIEKMDQDSSQITRKKIDTMDFKRQRELITMGGGNQ
jgi:hypothetical protein